MIVTGFTHRSKSANFFQTTVFSQHGSKFQEQFIIDVQTNFQQSFQRKNFLFSLSEQFKNSGMCISTAKTSKHKGETKTHQRRKKWKAKKSKQQKQKNKYAKKVHLKTSCNKSLGKLKESRKLLDDGKVVLLMVSWVRVDLDSFISLLSI